ncbi:MAG: PqqD family protein [Acidobacteriota bacterium]|nr:PqqD family protein [Acidobacteriota bacterium]
MVSSQLGDAGVLVHLRTNRIFEVNATGLRIWELAGQGRTLAEMEDTLRGEFDVEPARLRTELLDLVSELSREGLLETEGEN